MHCGVALTLHVHVLSPVWHYVDFLRPFWQTGYISSLKRDRFVFVLSCLYAIVVVVVVVVIVNSPYGNLTTVLVPCCANC